jgi:hypothetical protein
MSTRSPDNWASDPQAQGLRIETSSDDSFLLPFDQFAFAELKNESDEQRLRLIFATHEVTVRGHSLRRIETTMQRMQLAFLSRLPASQRHLVAEGQPVILEVTVIEVRPQESRDPRGTK